MIPTFVTVRNANCMTIFLLILFVRFFLQFESFFTFILTNFIYIILSLSLFLSLIFAIFFFLRTSELNLLDNPLTIRTFSMIYLLKSYMLCIFCNSHITEQLYLKISEYLLYATITKRHLILTNVTY
jgi:hypothetical protein